MKLTDFERMGGTYHQEGDYLIPNVVAPQSPQVGVWGERRRQFLLRNQEPIYTGMLLSGRLNAHLEEVDRSADEMFSQLVEQMAARDGITEQLKADNQMEWVCRLNAVRYAAEEAVLTDFIYT